MQIDLTSPDGIIPACDGLELITSFNPLLPQTEVDMLAVKFNELAIHLEAVQFGVFVVPLKMLEKFKVHCERFSG